VTDLVFWVLEIVFVVAAIRSPRSALMVMAISLPISRRLPAAPIPMLNYQNIIFVVALLSYAIHPPPKGAPGGRVRYALPMAILALMFTASFLNTITTFAPKLYWRFWDPYRNILQYRSLMMCLAVYVMASLVVRTRDDLIALMKAGLAGSLLCGLHTSYEFLILRPGRVTGFMDEPNNMGSFLACSLGLLLAAVLLLPRAHPYWRYLLAGMGATVIGLLGTLSRGSYLAAMVAFTLLTGMLNRRILAAGLIFLALNALWLPDSVKNRLAHTFVAEEDQGWRFRDGQGQEESGLIAMVNEELDEEAAAGELEGGSRLDNSIQLRLLVWTGAFRMMWDYPLGVGFGVFPWHMQYYSTVLGFKATHNIYLKIATESGIPALILFLFILFSMIRDSLKIARSADDPEIKAFGYGMFAYIVALMVTAFGVDISFQIEVNGHFWILMGALMQAPLIMAAREKEGPPDTAAAVAPRPPALYELVR
jgi:O-antigen ligase